MSYSVYALTHSMLDVLNLAAFLMANLRKLNIQQCCRSHSMPHSRQSYLSARNAFRMNN